MITQTYDDWRRMLSVCAFVLGNHKVGANVADVLTILNGKIRDMPELDMVQAASILGIDQRKRLEWRTLRENGEWGTRGVSGDVHATA